jgi:pilus assembly protein CpaE
MPVAKELLLDAIGRIQQRIAAARVPKRTGRTFSFVGCKGGSGVTFLAANIAYAIAQQDATKRVALLDLNCQFGDVALYVSHESPTANLGDVTREVHRLDGALLASSMLHVLPNLHVLGAPEEPEQALQIRPEHIDALLWVAASHYDIVIVDVGRSLDSISIRAMDASELIFPVLQLSVHFIRDAKRVVRALSALGYCDAKLRLLANRVEARGMVTLKDVSSTLRQQIAHTVPNGFAGVAASIDQGVPIVKLEPRNPVARALRDLARELVPAPEEHSGWIRNLLQWNERAASRT